MISTSVDCLVDTNVLVYACAKAGAGDSRRERARALLSSVRYGTSAQILQEFYVVVTRKVGVQMSSRLASRYVEKLSRLPCVAVDSNLVVLAIGISRRFMISYWDAAVLAAAQELGVATVYTEDLNHGQKYGTVTVINPFK